MTNQQLSEQQKRCEQWNDPDQWDALAMMYYWEGYLLNARYCFKKADTIRGCAFAESMPVEAAAV